MALSVLIGWAMTLISLYCLGKYLSNLDFDRMIQSGCIDSIVHEDIDYFITNTFPICLDICKQSVNNHYRAADLPNNYDKSKINSGEKYIIFRRYKALQSRYDETITVNLESDTEVHSTLRLFFFFVNLFLPTCTNSLRVLLPPRIFNLRKKNAHSGIVLPE